MESSRQRFRRVEAAMPRRFRILGAVFCLMMLLAVAAFATVLLFSHDRSNLPIIPAVAAMLLFPPTFLLLLPPTLLGYWPKWVSHIIPAHVLENVVNVFRSDGRETGGFLQSALPWFVIAFLVGVAMAMRLL